MMAPPFPSERKLGWASRTGLLTRAILLAGTFPELKLQWLSEFAQAKSLFRFEPEKGALTVAGQWRIYTALPEHPDDCGCNLNRSRLSGKVVMN